MNDIELNTYKEYYNKTLPDKYHIYDDNFKKMLEAKEQGAPMQYFDFHKLVYIILMTNPYKVMIGCKEDWMATSAVVYDEHQWVQTEYGDYYVQSIWDKPIIRVYIDDTDFYIEEECMTHHKQCPEETYVGENGAVIEHYNICMEKTR